VRDRDRLAADHDDPPDLPPPDPTLAARLAKILGGGR
jgi:hypothetical protein